VEQLAGATAVLPLAESKMLFAVPQGSGASAVVCLSPEDTPVTLLTLGGEVSGMSVTDGERSLLLTTGGAVLSVELDDTLACGEPAKFAFADGSAAPAPVATDTQGHVYVCTADGVQVLDDEGEPVLLVSLPDAPSGCCFGGAGRSTLFITAGNGVWALTTNVQGVAPPSESFQRRMDKFVAAGDFRHDGW